MRNVRRVKPFQSYPQPGGVVESIVSAVTTEVVTKTGAATCQLALALARPSCKALSHTTRALAA